MTEVVTILGETMQAVRVHAFGGPDAMVIETVPRPEPREGEILVQVKAAGVGPWDGWVRSGKSVIDQPLPLTPGSDIAGIVAAVGPNTEGFAVGEAVYGVTNRRFTDGYAEYAVAQAGMMAGKPESLSFIEAASVPVIAVTAWQALFEQARAAAGQTVLIHGAAGNVGAYAVQMARAAEAEIIATAGTDDLAFVESLGADRVIDYRAERFDQVLNDVDVVIDLVGGETQVRSFSVLKPGGYLISAVSKPDEALAVAHKVQAHFFLVDVTTMELTRIAEMIDAGELKTQIGLTMKLADVRRAHRILDGEEPAPRGKIVLEVAD
ncbi:MAG TPA: NADP-dependent oxidoreductase [Alphaproteobacteria bacterium]|jgi:NADPH:quinone reductase-like Zn-dependent oxidoreductase|nr:NADP-dependent oxidoreductase [Alphaproteobacteria bacterium]